MIELSSRFGVHIVDGLVKVSLISEPRDSVLDVVLGVLWTQRLNSDIDMQTNLIGTRPLVGLGHVSEPASGSSCCFERDEREEGWEEFERSIW